MARKYRVSQIPNRRLARALIQKRSCELRAIFSYQNLPVKHSTTHNKSTTADNPHQLLYSSKDKKLVAFEDSHGHIFSANSQRLN